MDITSYIANGGGICGTCASPASATAENEGYSSCCNDRIEYGDEAAETVGRANCPHSHAVEDAQVGDPGYIYRTCADCGEALDPVAR